jgi:trigger factor
VAGFPEQLVGLNPGDEKEFDMTYPADYGDEELAGQTVTFKVKVIGIKKEVLPEISDEFAKSIGDEFETMEQLRERAMKDMLDRAEERVKADFEDKVIHSLADISKVEYPPIMVESETNRILNQQFQRTGQSFEDYLKAAHKTEEELREELKPTAEHRLVDSLVLGKVAEAEAFEVSEGEIDEEIDEMTKNSNEKKEELKKYLNDPQVRESISRSILTRKTIAKLTEYALVEKETGTAGMTDEEESEEPEDSDKPKATRTRKKKKEETI